MPGQLCTSIPPTPHPATGITGIPEWNLTWKMNPAWGPPGSASLVASLILNTSYSGGGGVWGGWKGGDLTPHRAAPGYIPSLTEGVPQDGSELLLLVPVPSLPCSLYLPSERPHPQHACKAEENNVRDKWDSMRPKSSRIAKQMSNRARSPLCQLPN